MKLIVGLGNPDAKYAHTYHNLGFMAVDCLAKKLGVSADKKKCLAKIAEARVGGEKVVLAKPQTYMNLSGKSVSELVNYFRVPLADLVVIYDDYDLPKGHVRIRPSGSAGTHNGMRSVIAETGISDFARIRIGIRDESVNIPIINYVLCDVRKEDYDLFASACRRAAEAAVCLARGERMDLVMGRYNG